MGGLIYRLRMSNWGDSKNWHLVETDFSFGLHLKRFPIQLAIFDVDGVLTDTSELHYQSWKQVSDAEGLPFNRQDNEALRGLSRRESLVSLLKGHTLPEPKMQDLMERKNRIYLESLEVLTPEDMLPGVERLMGEIRQARVKIAIASSSRNARRVVEKLGIEAQVDAIVDGSSAARPKPAPDLFLQAARQVGIQPGQSVVFEDAESGIQAAQAAGMWVTGIGPEERVGQADWAVPSLAVVHWEKLVARLRDHKPGAAGEEGDQKGEEDRK